MLSRFLGRVERKSRSAWHCFTNLRKRAFNDPPVLKLAAVFAVLIAILLGVGQIGLRRMRSINETLGFITGRRSADLEEAQRALDLSNVNSRIIMEIVLVENRRLVGALEVTRSENSKEITRLIQEAEGHCESEKEAQLLLAVKITRKPYAESYMRAIHLLVDERKHDASEDVIVTETIPALLKYHAAWKDFVEFQKGELDDAVKQAEVDYANARRVFFLLIVGAAAVAIVIAMYATCQTARQMAARTAAQIELNKLNADLDKRVLQRTHELTDVNRQLAKEVQERRLAEENYLREARHRKSVEHKLQRSEERNRVAMEAAQIGYWDLDIIRDEHVWSDTCKALLGLPADSPANYEVLMNSVHPDDRKSMQEEIERAIRQKSEYSCQFRVLSGEGSALWRISKGRAFYDETGRPVRMTGITMDIDERKRSEERVLLQAAALEAAANAIVITDRKGTIIRTNRAFVDLTGYAVEEACGKNPKLLSSGKQSKEFYTSLWKTISTGTVWHGEMINRRKDGSLYNEEQTITPVRSGSGDITHFVAVKQDVTARKKAEEALLFKTALLEAESETTIDGILVVDESDRIVLANKQFGLTFGIPDELLKTGNDVMVRRFVAEQVENPEAFLENIEYLNSHRNERSRDELRLKNGNAFDRYTAPLVDSNGNYRGRIWYFRDITERKTAEEQIRTLAFYDALTGLPNRILLRDRLAQALARASRHQDKIALLFLDLDRFKVINDSLGHSIGDLLLKEVAERLSRQTREQDTVARLGGDEFVVVLSGVKRLEDCAITAERMMNALNSEFLIQGHSLNASCSLGISIFPDDGTDGETLIKHADSAMYCAKESGRNNFQFFTQDMNATMVQRLTLENSLRLAIPRNEFSLMYQPQMDIATGKISGVEALIRWQHPERGLVPPADFVPIAEDSGLIIPIGEWVLRSACAQAKKWQCEGLPPVTVAVNVSAVQFHQKGFVDLVTKVLRESGLPPQYLELELTESLILSNADVLPAMLKELRAIDVKLAIDDFGTGYSSFSYLRRFQVHKLKIDRSFVQDVNVDADNAAITSAIIGLAKSLNMKTIAEGVENGEQLAFLRAHECGEIQGYYFSKPLLADECAAKMRSHSLQPTQEDAESGKALANAARAQC
jgi:diguanylate cyclase (GGDEF)-like protein/PAS domain S-box-containing protein